MMEVRLRTLTPIWTGGVDGTMDRIHETGILGSLRWWYEAIVRGLGGDVCDPTSDEANKRCQFDTKAYEKTKNIEDGLKGVCPVCRLFGCTGWQRRFELQASVRLDPFWLATKDKKGKFNHWWLSQIYETDQNYVAFSELTLHFRWLRGYESQQEVMKALLSLVSQLGGIGSRTQYGFGIVLYEKAFSVEESLSVIRQNINNPEPRKNLSGEYPSLRNYWLLQCTVSKEDVDKQFTNVSVVGDLTTFQKYRSRLLPVSFDIRYKLPGSSDKGLRQSYRLKHDKMQTRKIFGTLEGDKRAGSVFVSHLYKEGESQADYQLRVWGFKDSALAGEIETSLRGIFPNLSCKSTKGSDLLNQVEA